MSGSKSLPDNFRFSLFAADLERGQKGRRDLHHQPANDGVTGRHFIDIAPFQFAEERIHEATRRQIHTGFARRAPVRP